MDYDLIYDNEEIARALYACPASIGAQFGPDLEVVNPLLSIPQGVTGFQALVERARDLEESNFITSDQLFGEELTVHDKKILNSIERVTKCDFLPSPVKEKQSVISLHMAMPLIGFLKKEKERLVKPRVLIIGGGYGKDIIRVRREFPDYEKMVITEPHRLKMKKLRKWFNDPRHHFVDGLCGLKVGEVGGWGPYDLIVNNMTFGREFGLSIGRNVFQVLRDLLKPSGVFFGSYFDIPTVMSAGLHHHMSYGHSVVYVSEDSSSKMYGFDAVNSIADISVGGITYRDPWLSTEQIHEAFLETGLSVEIIDGTMMMYGADKNGYYPPPAWFLQQRKRAEISLYRAVIITNSFEPPYIGIKTIPPSLRVKEWDGLALRSKAVPFNKGTCLIPEDWKWISKDTHWIGEKWDGIMVKIINYNKRLEIYGADKVTRKLASYTSPSDASFILQGELIDFDGISSLIVVDVLLAPWGAKGNFVSRWRWLEREVLNNAKVVDGVLTNRYPFSLQRWFNLYDPRVPSMIRDCHEGIVLQPIIAGYGSVIKGMGSAKYVKRVLTVDVRQGGKIVELRLDGTFVRERPDKFVANPPAVIERIKKGITLDLFVAFITKVSFNYSGPGEGLLNKLEKRTPVSEWTKDDIIDFHRTQYSQEMQERFGANLFVLRVQLHTRMAAEGTKYLEKMEEEAKLRGPDFDKFDVMVEDLLLDEDREDDFRESAGPFEDVKHIIGGPLTDIGEGVTENLLTRNPGRLVIYGDDGAQVVGETQGDGTVVWRRSFTSISGVAVDQLDVLDKENKPAK